MYLQFLFDKPKLSHAGITSLLTTIIAVFEDKKITSQTVEIFYLENSIFSFSSSSGTDS